MHLVIVESPTKAKTIRKFLGPDYHVVASMGHVRDLPASSEEIPEKFRKEPWANLGVNVDANFEPLYITSRGKTKVITELKKLMKDTEDIYLATDEDREGESISWHLLQILKPKVPVKRMVFHEITKSAIEGALKHPRGIDEKLVRAQETRRILDRLVGYSVSPVLWKKIAYGLSAGRVQSSALKALVDRERLRLTFKKGAYWDVLAHLKKDVEFEAKLVTVDGTRIASGKDFDENTGALKSGSEVKLLDEASAKEIAERAKAAEWTVREVNEKETRRKAPAPFTTSTLQQESNRKLGLSSRETMRVAQSLYERGYITYMRTDSVNLSAEAVKNIRGLVANKYGAEYLGPTRSFSTQAGAQEAHEAIRPSLAFTPPQDLDLAGAEKNLYELIWMRTIASQMKDAEQLQVTIVLDAANATFHATGMRIVFPGFLRAYVEGADNAEQALEEKERPLPMLAKGDVPECLSTEPLGHETKPPARFTEAALIQYMEKEGIGRPSTYASTISTLLDRGYVRKAGNTLIPTFTAMAVTQLLERHFGDLVDVRFTSKMEQALDKIAEGKEEWLPYLRTFFLGHDGLREKIARELEKISPEEAKTLDIPTLQNYRVKVGKFGPYVESSLPITGTEIKASLPDTIAPGDMDEEAVKRVLDEAQKGPTTLGEDPETGKPIFLRTGSYGPYLQLGEEEEIPPAAGKKKPTKIKPKRVSIPKHIPLETLDREKALKILSLPRLLGSHPGTGKEIRAGLGRFGPYIVHDGDFRSLKKDDDVLEIGLDRALELLAMPKGGRGRPSSGKEVGKHPDDGKPVTLHNGKFGPYVKHGSVNATLPKELKPDDVTLEVALDVLAKKKATTPSPSLPGRIDRTSL
ncbi:type I DNA topoisomerase [Candidatus Uhrbacteria bacterium]|nr:MAG: type I DNA topoisomerase [Candidatus Uhrbacteria bacterium]